VKYAFMRENREEFELKHMCRVLQVSRSGYYDWARRGESKRSQEDRALLKEIRKIHQETKEAYGATETWQALKQSGMACGKHRVARLRRQAGTLNIRCSRGRWLCYG
jgi:putative transposase